MSTSLLKYICVVVVISCVIGQAGGVLDRGFIKLVIIYYCIFERARFFERRAGLGTKSLSKFNSKSLFYLSR